jgi:uncharacterized membrane protein
MEENQVPTPEATDITDDDKLWALLSWLIWPVAILAIIMEDKKTRPFIKYNAVVSLVLGAVGSVLSAVLSAVIVGCFVGLAYFVYAIILGIKAYKGEWVTVPWLTDFVKNQGWAWAP